MRSLVACGLLLTMGGACEQASEETGTSGFTEPGDMAEPSPTGEADDPVRDVDKLHVVIVDGVAVLSAEPGAVTPGADIFVEVDGAEPPIELMADDDGAFSLMIPPGTSIQVVVKTEGGAERVFVESGAEVYCTEDDERYDEGEVGSVEEAPCVCTTQGWACAELPSSVPDACSVYSVEECAAAEECVVILGRLLTPDGFGPRNPLRCSSPPLSNCKLAPPMCVRHLETQELALVPNGCAGGPWEPTGIDQCMPETGGPTFVSEPTCSNGGLEFPPGAWFNRDCNGCECVLDDPTGETTGRCTAIGCGETEPQCTAGNAEFALDATFVEPSSCNTCVCALGEDGEASVQCDTADCPRIAPVHCPEEMLLLPSWPLEVTGADEELLVVETGVPAGETVSNFRLCHEKGPQDAPDGTRFLEVRLVHVGVPSAELESQQFEVNLWPLKAWLTQRQEAEDIELVGLGTELFVSLQP